VSRRRRDYDSACIEDDQVPLRTCHLRILSSSGTLSRVRRGTHTRISLIFTFLAGLLGLVCLELAVGGAHTLGAGVVAGMLAHVSNLIRRRKF
jgi:hypothetical protein